MVVVVMIMVIVLMICVVVSVPHGALQARALDLMRRSEDRQAHFSSRSVPNECRRRRL